MELKKGLTVNTVNTVNISTSLHGQVVYVKKYLCIMYDFTRGPGLLVQYTKRLLLSTKSYCKKGFR